MKCKKLLSASALIAGFLFSSISHATLVSITNCVGANSCDITTTPPNPVQPDPNDGILLAWNEKQNITLTEKLYVDRVFDLTASFVGQDSGGIFLDVGTIVSSHYVQWDPGQGSAGTVSATINTDSDIFAFIYADTKLFGTDALLGLDGFDYNDFQYRGLEGTDSIAFNGGSADISWGATTPGDWTRMITAFSPAADQGQVPVPAPLALLGLGLVGIGLTRKRKL